MTAVEHLQSWVKLPHIHNVIELDDRFESAQTPPGFIDGFQLFPFEAVTLQAMLDLEQNRSRLLKISLSVITN